MKRILRYTVIALLAVHSAYVVALGKIHFAVPEFKPYTYFEKGQLKGLGVDRVDELMAEMGVDYDLTLVPNYGRAVAEVQIGRADGFFLATQNAQRDEIAEFSEPVTHNRWNWFFLHDSTLLAHQENFKALAKIGTIINTNTHIWLKDNGYNVSYQSKTPADLIKMLAARRVDAVFVAEAVFENAAKKFGFSQFQKTVEMSRPFGIYISKKFLKKNPDFLVKLNAAINLVNNRYPE